MMRVRAGVFAALLVLLPGLATAPCASATALIGADFQAASLLPCRLIGRREEGFKGA